MNFKKISLFVIVFILSIQTTSADIITKIQERYVLILDNFEQSYSPSNFQKLLDTIDSRIDQKQAESKKSEKIQRLFIVLKAENKKRRSAWELVNPKDLETPVVVATNDPVILQQRIVENTTRENLKNALPNLSSDEIALAFEDAWFEVIGSSSLFEFVDGNDIKKVNFKRYLAVDASNYKRLLLRHKLSKLWTTLVYDGEKYYIPTQDLEIDTKINYSEAREFFLDSVDSEENYVLQDGVYYTYDYDSYFTFEDQYGFYADELEASDFTPSESILLRQKWGFKIIKNYTKRKLIDASILSWIQDPKWFLKVIIKDIAYTSNTDNDENFIKLKALTKALTTWKTPSQKIEAIYAYILQNHYYYENFTDGTEEIFSGIDTFSNGYGVCDGYSKLMYYMLSYAGISDIEHIRWYVIDAVDFPQIWHAWVRIGDYYYDPTFDDPVGQPKTLKPDEYRYFKLPRDLAYTNRTDGFNISESIKRLPLQERERQVEKKLYDLLDVYEMDQYNLLKPFQIKEELWLIPWDVLTVEKLKESLEYYKVAQDFSFTAKSWAKRYVSEIKYYVPTDDNIWAIMDALWQDFTDSVFLEWEMPDGTTEYRIAYVFRTR